MKILVTGGAGFIGSHLSRTLLLDKGADLVIVDKLTYAGNLSALSDISDRKGFHFEQVDICDGSAMRKILDQHQPDAVMHLAAESHVDRSISAPAAFIQTNVFGTFSLLEATTEYWNSLSKERKDRFRFLHVSTDEVYGSLGRHDPPFTETNRYQPRSPYSASKAASDHFARSWQKTYGLPVIITNCSNNYGPWQYPEKLIPVVILKATNGEPIPIYGNGENVRDWLYVTDHCEALWLVLTSGTVGETYNIGGDNELTNIELVKSICCQLDKVSPRADCESYLTQIEFVTDRPGHDFRYAIDASKITNELGWSPQISLADGMEKTLEFYLKHTDSTPSKNE